ncbi:MAG: nodulation protein NfeD [Acidobacteriota bacterium]
MSHHAPSGVSIARLTLAALCLAAGAWLVSAQEPAAPSADNRPAAAATEAAGDPAAGDPAAGAPAAGDPATGDPGPVTPSSRPKVIHLRVDSVIHPIAAEFVLESLDYADEIGANAVVIELSTPGGLVDSTRQMWTAMLGADTPVVVWVAPIGSRAASAGFFLLIAADIAAMAPGTNTGAAHPVAGTGEDIEGNMGEKVEQDAAAAIRSLARQQGRNVELAEAGVIESRSFTAEEALDYGLIDLVARNLDELLLEIDGQVVEKANGLQVALSTGDARVETLELDSTERFLSAVAQPWVALVLLAIGVLGIFIELSNPGMIVPGAIGAICLLLSFYGLSVLVVNYLGVALIVAAIGLFAAELFVVSYGAFTVAGAVSLFFGLMMVFQSSDPALWVDWRLILAVTVAIVCGIAGLMFKSVRVGKEKVKTGSEGLVGEHGVVRRALAPSGKVFVHGELWQATADTELPAGTEVEVVAVDGLRIEVRALAQPSTAEAVSA